MLNSVNIIIVTFNGMPWLKKCLDSCADYSVIIVDNGSTDETITFIETNYPNVRLLKQSENLGFGQANNIGISHALKSGMDYVFLLNQDAYLKPRTIQSIIEVAESNRKYGILSPLHFNGAETQLDSNFLQFIERSNTHSLLLKDYIQNTVKEVYDTKFVNAAAWLLSKSLLLAVGGFDPLFFHYGEDRNYCQRALYHDFNIGIVPNAIVLHDREDRKQVNVPKFSSAYYLEYEKYMKIEFGDINEKDMKFKLGQKLKKLRHTYYKSLLKFNIQNARDAKTKYYVLKKIKNCLSESTDLNRKHQANYLTL